MAHLPRLLSLLTVLGFSVGTSVAQTYGFGSHAPIHAKALHHNDGTRTDSYKDPSKREITDTMYDARGIVIAKKKFLTNERGEATQGVIYDGADNVIARVIFYFDTLGRVTEERCVNTSNQIFRRVIRQYDANGNPQQPMAFDFAVNAPVVKPANIDFTKSTPPPQDGAGQQVHAAAGRGAAAAAAPEEPKKKKRGLFGFGKKK